MMGIVVLEKLPTSSETLWALIVELWEALQKLKNKPQKTSKNSSLPPSKGFKAGASNRRLIHGYSNYPNP
jgi:transposase